MENLDSNGVSIVAMGIIFLALILIAGIGRGGKK